MRAICLTFSTLLFMAQNLAAEVFRVPQEYATIALAAAASDEGDEIHVKAKVHIETVVLNDIDERIIRGIGKVVVQPAGAGPGVSLTNCDFLTLQNLRFLGATVRGIDASGCNDLTIKSCRVSGSGSDGIRALGGVGVLLERNSVRDVVGIGINVQCDQVLIDRNVVRSAGLPNLFDGIVVQGASVAVTRNTVRDVGDDGIQIGALGGSTDNAVVRDNRVFDAFGDGILMVDTEAALVQGNRVEGAGDEGIDVAATCNADSLSDNRVVRSGGSGIEVDGTSIKVVSNRVIRPVVHGILVAAAADGGVVGTNQVNRANGDGIRLQSETHTLFGNRTRRSTGDGLVDETLGGGTSNILFANRFN